MHINVRTATFLLQALVFFSIVSPPFILESIRGLVEGPESSASSLFRQVTYLAIFVASSVILVKNRADASLALRAVNPLLWMFLLYIASSVLWSWQAELSVKRGVLIIGTAIVGLAFVTSAFQDTKVKVWSATVIRPVVTLLVIASAIYSVILPHVGMHADGAWRGMTYHKNGFGQVTVLCALLWLIAGHDKSAGFVKCSLLVGFSLFMLLLSHSATSLAAMVAAILVLMALRCARSIMASFNTSISRVPISAPACLLAILIFLFGGHILTMLFSYPSPAEALRQTISFLRRDVTLTGRIDAWQLLLNEITNHPWLGTGYQAFWESGKVASQLLDFTGGAGYGHNGYLDLLNELGVIGFSLMFFLILSHTLNLWRLREASPNLALGHTLLLVTALVLNFGESTLFQPTGIWSVVLVVSIIEVSFALNTLQSSPFGRAARQGHS